MNKMLIHKAMHLIAKVTELLPSGGARGGYRLMQAAGRQLAALCVHHSLFIAVANYALFTIIYSLISCDRLPLELYTKGDSEVNISCKMNTFNKVYYNFLERHKDLNFSINGLSIMYAKDGDSINITDVTHDTDSKIKKEEMENGHYKVLVMTNTMDEYAGNMKFYNTNDYNNMYAVSEKYFITDQDAWDAGQQYMVEPMLIGVAVDSFDVTHNNDNRIFYEYNKSDDAFHNSQDVEYEMLPMTTTLYIRVKVVGINYMKDPQSGGVDGYITGLANGFNFSTRWRREEVGNIKLNNWHYYNSSGGSRELTFDNERKVSSDYKTGWVETTIETFGLPHGRELSAQRTENSNFIKLHFTTLDGKTIDFSYNVGKMIRYKDKENNGALETFTQEDIALELDLKIDAPFVEDAYVPIMPYAQPEGSGQFDAEVQPWGEEQNVDVPM